LLPRDLFRLRGGRLLAAGLAVPLALAPAPAAAQQPGMTIRDDAARKEMVIEVGPVDLPGGAHRQLPAFHGQVPIDGWVHGYRIEIVDAAGREVPRRTLHHVNVITPAQRELFSQIMLRVAAAGQETDPVTLPRMIGYRVRPGQPLIVTAMLHNTAAADYRGVRLRVRFPYTRSDARLKPISVLPFYIDVMPPASLHSYDLAPGRSEKSWEARPAVSGRVLAIGGHLHQYGVSLRLEDVAARRVIWDGRPEVDERGEVVGMPVGRFVWRLGVPVRAGRLYRVTAVYENPTGRVIPGGGMGALGGVIVPDDESRWPGIDRGHPELKLDWQLVHTGNQDGSGTGHGARGSSGSHAHRASSSAAKPAASHAH